MSWNVSTGAAAWYKDGEFVHSEVGTGRFQQPPQPHTICTIGQEPDAFVSDYDELQALDAVIDEFRIWETARTPEQVRAFYNHSITSPTPGLVVNYNFDGGSGDVTDASGRGHTGLLGRLPLFRNVLVYATERPPAPPTAPHYVASTAPVTGSGVTLRVLGAAEAAAGARVVVTLPASTVVVGGGGGSGGSMSGSAALVLNITRLPMHGTLTLLSGGAPLAVGSTVVDAAHSQSKRLIYTPTSANFVNDSIAYSVALLSLAPAVAASPTAHGTVRILNYQTPTAPNLTLYGDEDSTVVAVLGQVQPNGGMAAAVITSLPANGTLYHARLPAPSSASAPTYSSIRAQSPATLTPITTVPTLLRNRRGIVLFRPHPDAAAGRARPYATFTYALLHNNSGSSSNSTSGSSSGGFTINSIDTGKSSTNANSTGGSSSGGLPSVLSAPATVTVFIVRVNDAPVASPQWVTVPSDAPSLITLASSDADTNFSPHPFYRVTAHPGFGRLLQVADNVTNATAFAQEQAAAAAAAAAAANAAAVAAASSSGGSGGSDSGSGGSSSSSGSGGDWGSGGGVPVPDARPPSVVSWAAAALNSSSQFSQCGRECYHQLACPASCTLTGWHASQIVGRPDVYPRYGDLKGAWQGTAGDNPAGEWIEVEFTDHVYLLHLEVFETFNPGAITRVLLTDHYRGPLTRWVSAWHGPPTLNMPHQSRVFSPPVCPIRERVVAIRLELDTAAIPSWQNLDAVRVIGSLSLPRGAVTHASGHLLYRPPKGVHSAVPNASGVPAPADSFVFAASDCEAESAPATVNITIAPPLVPATASAWRTRVAEVTMAQPSILPLDIQHARDALSAILGVPLNANNTPATVVVKLLEPSALATAAAATDHHDDDHDGDGDDDSGIRMGLAPLPPNVTAALIAAASHGDGAAGDAIAAAHAAAAAAAASRSHDHAHAHEHDAAATTAPATASGGEHHGDAAASAVASAAVAAAAAGDSHDAAAADGLPSLTAVPVPSLGTPVAVGQRLTSAQLEGHGLAVQLPATTPGGALLVTWVTLRGVTFRDVIRLRLACTRLFAPVSRHYPVAGAEPGSCVPCSSIPQAQRRAMAAHVLELFNARCVKEFVPSRVAEVVALSATALAALVSTSLIVAVTYYRRHAVMRFASWRFCLVILGGSGLTLFVPVILWLPASDTTCILWPLVAQLGYSLSYGSLFAKTYRLVRLFDNKRLARRQITDRFLGRVVLMVVIVLMSALLLWFLLSPPHAEEVALVTRYTRCHASANSASLLPYLPLALDFALLLAGVYLTVRNRATPDVFNENRYIAMSIYNLTVISVMVFSLLWLLPSDPDTQLVVSALGIAFLNVVSMLCLFLPKLTAIWAGVTLDDMFSSSSRRNGGGTTGSSRRARRQRSDESSAGGSRGGGSMDAAFGSVLGDVFGERSGSGSGSGTGRSGSGDAASSAAASAAAAHRQEALTVATARAEVLEAEVRRLTTMVDTLQAVRADEAVHAQKMIRRASTHARAASNAQRMRGLSSVEMTEGAVRRSSTAQRRRQQSQRRSSGAAAAAAAGALAATIALARTNTASPPAAAGPAAGAASGNASATATAVPTATAAAPPSWIRRGSARGRGMLRRGLSAASLTIEE